MTATPRLLAFHLPQYHPIPENDAWWGKGFTEWTNVAKARPLFRGHHQPHLPADLGFYDLRLPEAREAQADLARAYGVHGFCYYHYWFNGRRLLERPVDEILRSGRPDFPFCLCWANENWTRAWDGMDREILLEQHYGEEDDRAHLRSLAPAFADPRYVRVDGKPLFLIYRASHLPDMRRTTDVWREEAARLGLGDLFLCRVEGSFPGERGDPRALGFDAAIEFQPDLLELFRRLSPERLVPRPPGWPGLARRVREGVRWRWRRLAALAGHGTANHSVFDYRRLPEIMSAKPEPDYLRFPGVSPGWDNSPRRQSNGAIIFTHSTPEAYARWLESVLRKIAHRPPEHQLVFVNAWNEWAEGCHLEPCQRWGCAYLEATRQALQRAGRSVDHVR